MFKFFFWKWFKQPQVGDIFTHEYCNPFQRSQIKILEIREDYAKVKRFSPDYGMFEECDIVPLQNIIAFYKKVA